MVDNTTINAGSGGDLIRDIDRSGVKTQVMQIDAGGQGSEALVSGASPMPVADPYTALGVAVAYRQLLTTQAGGNGFVPIEFPNFLFS